MRNTNSTPSLQTKRSYTSTKADNNAPTTTTEHPKGISSFQSGHHQGSITALTDEEGNIVESFLYDEAYGTILDHHKTVETYNPYCYTGREFDSKDLYYYRARYYDPSVGRFISSDPIEFLAGDTNFYRYVGNDPVNFVDPFGHKKCDKANKDKRKKSLKKKGGKFQNVLEKMGKKAAKRAGLKGVISGILAALDGPAPVGDAIALMIMGTEIKALTDDVKDIQGAIENIRSEINEMIECEKESDKKDGQKVKGEKDKCKSLEGKNDCKNNPTGAYSGGKHGALKNGGNSCSPPRESHHMPADKSYPSKSKPKRDEMPAILMDKSDHAQTLSHSNGYTSQAYKGIQKKLIENNLMVVAMAMDIANIKWIAEPPDKYDDAISQMLLWAICKGII